MTATRRQLLGWLILAAVASFGCNPLTLPFFLLYGFDDKVPAEFPLRPHDDKKDVTVVILASCGQASEVELLGVDRDLASEFGKKLRDACLANKERVTIIPAHKVERYKLDRPGWKTAPLSDIGKHFNADYVIDLEVNDMTLFEPRSRKQMYRGSVSVSLAVVDVEKPEEGPVYKKEYTKEYPSRGPIPADGSTPAQFRMLFLARVATDLSWLFTSHAIDQNVTVD